jgi:uncharacterized protein
MLQPTCGIVLKSLTLGRSGREMIKRYAISLLLVFVTLLPISVLAQSAPAPTPAIWRIKDGASTVYVFGSLHILPQSFQWRSSAVETAMQASDIFVFEVPVDAEATERQKAFIVKNGLLPRTASLRQVLNRSEFQTYSRILLGAGLKPEHFTRYRPWLAAVVVGLAYVHRRGLTMLRGVDDDIIEYAQGREKELRYLETIEEQMQLLIRGDDRSQVTALKQQLVALPRSIAHTEDLLNTWARGDAEAFANLIERDFAGHREAQDFLISNRNRAWVPTIRELLQAGRTTLVTVGAAHIGGPSGVVALLCAAGHQVERLGDNGAPDTDACARNS